MKKSEVLLLHKALNRLGNLTGVKFAYAVSKNINILKNEIESLDKAMEPSEKFMEYDKARIALVELHAEKDDKGKAKIITSASGSQQYDIDEENKMFKKAFDALKEKHKEAVGAREKQVEEYIKLLETDSDVKVYKVKLEDVPKEITVVQMAGIDEIVDGE